MPARAGAIASQKLNDLSTTLINAIKSVWQNEDQFGVAIDPQEIISAYGTLAVEAFTISTNTSAYLIEQAPLVLSADASKTMIDNINAALALIKPTTAHQDGSITVN